MKKIITLLLICNLVCAPLVFGLEEEFDDAFVDTLTQALDKNLTVSKKSPQPIVDEFVIKTLDSNLKIKPQKQPIIKDELLSNLHYKALKTYKPADFENILESAVVVRPIKSYSTRNLSENQYIYFNLAQDSIINNKTYKKGETIKASVETVTKNGAYGVPADFTIGNFVLVSNSIPLDGQITKTGANRSLWVNTGAYLLSPFFGLGLLMLPIRGGHAKLSPNRTYELNF